MENKHWIPKTPRDSVIWFAEIMEAKLKLDDNKPNWEAEYIGVLWDCLKEEKVELFEALSVHQRDKSPRNTAKVIQEAADLANFCMFIASLVDPEKSKNIRGHRHVKEDK